MGNSRDVAVGTGSIEARLEVTIVDQLLEGLTSVRGLSLLVT